MVADRVPTGELPLIGPSQCGDRARLPLRGDLAHIRLAGRCFVPHYAEPLRRRVRARGATLRVGASDGAAAIAGVASGTWFEVLDLAGGWAWGQVDEAMGRGDGLVGYLPQSALEAP